MVDPRETPLSIRALEAAALSISVGLTLLPTHEADTEEAINAFGRVPDGASRADHIRGSPKQRTNGPQPVFEVQLSQTLRPILKRFAGRLARYAKPVRGSAGRSL
jgi:hypothetical protein